MVKSVGVILVKDFCKYSFSLFNEIKRSWKKDGGATTKRLCASSILYRFHSNKLPAIEGSWQDSHLFFSRKPRGFAGSLPGITGVRGIRLKNGLAQKAEKHMWDHWLLYIFWIIFLGQ